MSYTAALFNATLSVLKAACTPVDPDPAVIAVAPGKVFLANLPLANISLPAMIIRLPIQPYDSGAWSGSGNIRDNEFKVEVALVAEMPTDGDHPSGDDTTDGILTLADAVQNVLDTARADFRAASPAYVDHQTTTSFFQNEQGTKASATIAITFKVRYVAGSR